MDTGRRRAIGSQGGAIREIAARERQKRNEPHSAAHRNTNCGDLSGERFDRAGKAAFVARSLIFMHDFFIGNAVDNAGRLLKYFERGSLIAAFNRFTDFLNGGTERRT